jgi:hypothetical protein
MAEQLTGLQCHAQPPRYSNHSNILSTETQLPASAFNWDKVYEWDPDVIKRNHDADTMNAILNAFVTCELSKPDAELVNNPLVLRLLRLLQIVLEHMVHSSTELSSLYGVAIRDATQFRVSLSRAKQKLRTITSKVESVRNGPKCPTCSQIFPSDLELDCHFHRDHLTLETAWNDIRALCCSSPL